jgi:predicted O-linked N-acetylglucosamine transferase (SPINDLY family)
MLFDALWMGVPVLTLASRPPLGRIGSSLMTNLGMNEWIAETEEDYVHKAINFASDFDSLALIRESLRERMINSPLMDEVSFAGDVEAAYQKMWQRLCENNQK